MIRKLPQLASLAGIVLLVTSLVWWQQTFGLSIDYLKCIAFSDGVCRLSSVGKLFGGAGYNPVIFWAGLILFVIGYLLRKLKIL